MKAACLIARMLDGSMVGIPSETLDPLLLTAKEARATGLLNGAPVLEGSVLANWRLAEAYKFRVVPEVRAGVQAGDGAGKRGRRK